MKAITLNEAASRLSVCYETMRRKAQAGEIPAFKLGAGREWRILEDDFLKYVRDQYSPNVGGAGDART